MKIRSLIPQGMAIAALLLCATIPGLAQEPEVKTLDRALNPPKMAGDRSVVQCPDKETVKKALKSIAESVPRVQPTAGSLPPDCSEVSLEKPPTVYMGFGQTRGWEKEQFKWTAPGLVHEPIYFEDLPLERYGVTRGPLIQPLVSHARFFAVWPTLPYRMSLDPPYKAIATLGYDRPGNNTPMVRYRLPFSPKAAVVQTASVAGLILLIP